MPRSPVSTSGGGRGSSASTTTSQLQRVGNLQSMFFMFIFLAATLLYWSHEYAFVERGGGGTTLGSSSSSSSLAGLQANSEKLLSEMALVKETLKEQTTQLQEQEEGLNDKITTLTQTIQDLQSILKEQRGTLETDNQVKTTSSAAVEEDDNQDNTMTQLHQSIKDLQSILLEQRMVMPQDASTTKTTAANSIKATSVQPQQSQQKSQQQRQNPVGDTSPQNPRLRPDQLKLPTPIMVMGLMKAGTTSIYGYFKCGLDPTVSKLSHYDCKPRPNIPPSDQNIRMPCARRMRNNIQIYKDPPFTGMDQFHLYAELDGLEGNGGMTLPQYSFLQEIYDSFPNATWILNQRDPIQWLASIDRWKDLRQRFISNNFGKTFFRRDFPVGKGITSEEMIDFFHEQADHVRNFTKFHPSLHFIEVAIDDPMAGQIMEDAFGITKECWGNRNVNDGTGVWKQH